MFRRNKWTIYITEEIPKNRDNEHRKKIGGIWVFKEILHEGNRVHTWIHRERLEKYEPFIELEIYSPIYPNGIRVKPKGLSIYNSNSVAAAQLMLILNFNK